MSNVYHSSLMSVKLYRLMIIYYQAGICTCWLSVFQNEVAIAY